MSHQSARKMTSPSSFISWVACVPIARKGIRQGRLKVIIRTLSWEQATLRTTQTQRGGEWLLWDACRRPRGYGCPLGLPLNCFPALVSPENHPVVICVKSPGNKNLQFSSPSLQIAIVLLSKPYLKGGMQFKSPVWEAVFLISLPTH